MRNRAQMICRAVRPAAGKKRSEEGFTLIELAIALAILGILVAVAVPTYLSVRNRAYDAEAKQVLGEIRATAWSEFLENNAFPTVIEDLGYPVATTNDYVEDRWTYSLNPGATSVDIIATGTEAGTTAGRTWTLTLGDDGDGQLTGP